MTQIKFEEDLENTELTDPIYIFNEIMDQIDLSRYYSYKKTIWAIRDIIIKD